MDDRQKNAIHNHRQAIVDCIEAHLVHALIDLTQHGSRIGQMHSLEYRDILHIQMQQTPYGQTTELIRLLQCRENGFQALTAVLRCYGRADLAATLEEQSAIRVTSPDMKQSSTVHVHASTKPSGSYDNAACKFISDLKQFTRQYCEVIRQHWKDNMAVDDLEHAFVPLTLVNEKELSSKYKWNHDDLQNLAFLFVDEVRIFITGEPGFGKSTLLNKIAYDWAADKHPALTKHFDFVYYLPLREATGRSLYEAVLEYLPFDDKETSSAIINKCFTEESYRSRTLFLLDAFDEVNFKSFPALTWIVEGRVNPLAKCVITSRPLQVADFSKPVHISARGFDTSAQAGYVTKHVRDAGLRALILGQNLELFKCPFFLTVVCLLANQNTTFYFQGLSAVFELFKEYHEWLLANAVENKKMQVSVKDYKLTLIEVGKFALREMLQSSNLKKEKELTELLERSVGSNNDHMLLNRAVHIGVITAKTVRGVDNPRVVYGFLHKLLAEYLCAVYLNHLISSTTASWWTSIPSTGMPAEMLPRLLLADYDHFRMVSYFLSGLSKDYFHAVVQHLLTWNIALPRLCDTFELPQYTPRTIWNFLRGRDWGDTEVSTALLAALLSGGSADRSIDLRWLHLQSGWLSTAVQYNSLVMWRCTIPSDDESWRVGAAHKLARVTIYSCRIHSFNFLQHLRLQQLSLENVDATDEVWLQLFAALQGGLSGSLQVLAWSGTISATVYGQLPTALSHMQVLRHLELYTSRYIDVQVLSTIMHDVSDTLKVLILHLPHHRKEEKALIKKQLAEACTKSAVLKLFIW